MKILITGGAGFVGSSIANHLKLNNPKFKVSCFDNLIRHGSKINLKILKKNNINFIKGDIRNIDKIKSIGDFDLMIECAAETSVMSSKNSKYKYLIDTNLIGTINCLQVCKERNAKFLFLSSSRVYPINILNSLSFKQFKTRYELKDQINIIGASAKGISEELSLNGHRSLYGASKLASEIIINEFNFSFGLKTIINRCGMIAGPGQFGKEDQGVITYWLASHYWRKPLKYIGYGGSGKQLRDVLNIKDLCELIELQIKNFEKFNNNTFNVGGGNFTISLRELTKYCSELTGNELKIKSEKKERFGDVRVYKTNNNKISTYSGWKPKRDVKQTLLETYMWLQKNEKQLKLIFK
jgi:CDP-paratose 2-epimerase